MDLLQLQDLCKRDGASYRDEFLLQLRHFSTELDLLRLKPSSPAPSFAALASFLAHVCTSYRNELADVPQQLMDLVEKNHSLMDPELRKCVVKALILMRNKNFLAPTSLLCLFFKLFRCDDKVLRGMLYAHIVNDIKTSNANHKNNKLNKTLQNFLFGMLQDSNENAAKKSLDVMMELHRKRVWNDTRTVNVISTACFSTVPKIKVAALQFFLSNDTTDEEEEKPRPSQQEVLKKHSTRGVKTRKRVRKLREALKKCNKQPREREASPNFLAIELLNDPQNFAEKLLAQLKASKERFEVKLMCMNLTSRLVGFHKLLLLNFYPFLARYLHPRQQHVTSVLAIAAQAAHDLVPPEALSELVRTIANNFVTEHGSPEATAIGLNTIREICNRQPWSLDKELLREFAQYKRSRDKGVMMASRSLIMLYRTVHPTMLHKQDRGKGTDLSVRPKEYGEATVESLSEPEVQDEQSAFVIQGTPIQAQGSVTEIPADERPASESWFEDRNGRETKPLTPKLLVPNIPKPTTEVPTSPIAGKRKRKELEQSSDEEKEQDALSSVVVDVGTIESYTKKQRMNKEERLNHVKQGREGREKFGYKQKKSEGSSKSNKEKSRNKPFMLTKQSKAVRAKQRMSIRDKQKRKGKKRGRR